MIFRLDGVTKWYGRHRALDHLSIDVRPGAIGLLGPNGAGKSTLIKILLGLVRLSAGQASVLDLDVRASSRQIRQHVGYMPEDDCYITGLSGIQAVAYIGELAGLVPRTSLRRAHEMMDYVGIAEERYREVQTYSTGMKQKLRLAQALIHSPKIVLLDEPTSGLDPQSRERMIHLVRNLAWKKGVSVVVSTHILHDVELCCDSVMILGRGKLLVYDTLENLRRAVDRSTTVRILGEPAPFAKALAELGCPTKPLGADELQVLGEPTAVSGALFQAAERSGVVVRQIAPSRTSLEDIFLQAVSGE